MTRRVTNLALLLLTTLSVLTGFTAFAIGTPVARWVVVVHGLLGLSMLVLAPWKSAIARRGMAHGGSGRWVSLSLSVAAVSTIGTGLILIAGFVDRIGPFTVMQAHVGGGLATLLLTAVHARIRPNRLRRSDLTRRNALRAAGLLGIAGLFYAGVESILSASRAPGSNRRFTGSHEIGRNEPVPATQWLNDRVPQLDDRAHLVEVNGRPVAVSEIDDQGDLVEATLDCTGGWYATRRWSGSRLDRLIGDAEGESLIVRSVTGYWRRFPLEHAHGLWLVTRIDETLLSAGNGAPVRLVAPGRRGFWWVKWVERIEIDDLPPWWQPPLPTA